VFDGLLLILSLYATSMAVLCAVWHHSPVMMM
jgi:hypothetical protein